MSILSTYALRIGIRGLLPGRVAHQHDRLVRRVALDLVRAVGVGVRRLGGGVRQVLQILLRHRVGPRQVEGAGEVAGRCGQGEVHRQIIGRVDADARDVVARHVRLLSGFVGARHVAEGGAIGGVTGQDVADVGLTGPREGRVAAPLHAPHHVGRGHLARRRRVPHRTLADGDRILESIVGNGRHRRRQIGSQRERLTHDTRVGVQLTLVHLVGHVVQRVVAIVGIEVVIDVTAAEHGQGAASLGRPGGVGVFDLQSQAGAGTPRARPRTR